ncbi:MAG: PepSY-associated helix domain protein [Candidatus Solibacter sp.]|nr:PepSY-associated helix domain protein [Candidatus Solibacter sp.]
MTVSEAPAKAHPHNYGWKHTVKKLTVTWARWLHIYLSMVSFGILFFFAVTGLTVNHPEWFTSQQKTVVYKGQAPVELVRSADKLRIVELLRKQHGIHSELSDFRVDDAQFSVSFKGPGYTADTFIDRDSGKYEVTETRMGWGAVINDLHKGRDTGRGWKALIDASAVLMTLVSVTGLALIFFLAKRRVSGLVCLGVGAGACWAVWTIFVK